jgi:1-acyl-sn-glycerol-3-phosphate acyltransferase
VPDVIEARPSFLARLIAAVRSIAAYLFISLYTLAVGPPALLVALAFRWPGILYALGIFAARLALGIVGIRYRVEGASRILHDRAAVYAVNHASNVEPPIVFSVLRRLAPRLRILYKQELHGLPILNRAFDLAGFIPVDRGNREQTRLAVDAASRALEEGNSFVIFPEGTRSRTGDLLPFKSGGFVMAINAGAPVVPMAISGARFAMRKGSFLIHPVTVTVRIEEPVETRGLTLADRGLVVTEVRDRIADALSRSAGAGNR